MRRVGNHEISPTATFTAGVTSTAFATTCTAPVLTAGTARANFRMGTPYHSSFLSPRGGSNGLGSRLSLFSGAVPAALGYLLPALIGGKPIAWGQPAVIMAYDEIRTVFSGERAPRRLYQFPFQHTIHTASRFSNEYATLEAAASLSPP